MLEHKYKISNIQKFALEEFALLLLLITSEIVFPVLPVDEIIVKKAFITVGELGSNGTSKISSKHNVKNFTKTCYITLYFIQSCKKCTQLK